MKNIIYMDYQATTPCDPRVLGAMMPYFCEDFGNPHSVSHVFGETASKAVEKAREQVANLIAASDPREVIFTSGATESNNVAIQGVSRFYREKGRRIVTSVIEHKCVLESFKAMASEGFEVVMVPVLSSGIIDLRALQDAVDERTTLVSIIHVNNEIGVIQPIDEISEICRRHGALLHIDAAQSVGKIPVDASKVDLMSISGHKIYGPKGVGALYVRMKPRVRLTPIFFGGGQERGIRSGTLPTPLCVGLGEACRIAQEEMASEHARLTEFKNYFVKKILDNLEKTYINGDPKRRIPGCLNFRFDGVEGESIMLGMSDVCLSSGSACTSRTLEPSHVLKAISDRDDVPHMSLRIGFGRFTTFQEIEYVSSKIIEVVKRLRSMSPLWENAQ